MKPSKDQARAAKRRLAARIGDVPQVNGIGITRDGDGYGLKVNLVTPLSEAAVPQHVDGVRVTVDVVGPAMPA